MAEDRRRVELELGLDPGPLHDGIREAEQDIESLRRAVERLGQSGDPFGQTTQRIPFPPGVVGDQRLNYFGGAGGAGAGGGVGPIPTWDPGTQSNPYLPPQLHPQQVPVPSMPGGFGGGGSAAGLTHSTFYQEMKNELGGIRDNLFEDPRRSQARLGMLGDELEKQKRDHPENYDEFIELNKTLKDLNTILKESRDKQGFEQFQKFLGIANIGQQVLNGNFLGAAGGAIGLVGGPLGSIVGSTVGNMLQGVVNSGEGPAQFRVNSMDTVARFGAGFGNVENLTNLGTGWLADRGRNYGYGAEDTVGHLEQARQSRLVDSLDEEAVAIVTEMQGLSRALGLTAEATIALEGTYRRTGGEGTAGSHLAEVVSGAISAGMREHIGEYAEVLTSSRYQMVQRTGQGLENDELLMRMVNTLVGGEAGALFRNNPGMAQEGISGIFGVGATTDIGSTQAAFLNRAGVSYQHMDPRFNSPEQIAANAMQLVAGSTETILLESQEESIRRAQADPNYVRDVFTSEERGIQSREMFGQVFGPLSPTQTQALITLTQNYLSNGGDLNSVTESGALDEFVREYSRDAAAEYREAVTERQDRMLQFFQNFMDAFISMKQNLSNIWGVVNAIGDRWGFQSISDNETAATRLGDALTEAQGPDGTGDGLIDTRGLRLSNLYWGRLREHAETEAEKASLLFLSNGNRQYINSNVLAPVFERYQDANGDPQSDLSFPGLTWNSPINGGGGELMSAVGGSYTRTDRGPTDETLTGNIPGPSSSSELFEGGQDAWITRVVGYSEGNRTLGGGFTQHYAGHTDPGNGVQNNGSFSSQHGYATGEEADAHWLGELQSVWPLYESTMREHGFDPNDPRMAGTFADMYTQSPVTAVANNPHSYLGQIRARGSSDPFTDQELLDMRVLSYRDPNTHEFQHAFGEEGGTADQARRNAAVLAAVEHYGDEFQPAQGGAAGGDRTINVNVNVNGADADAENIREAAYQGVISAEDDLDRDFARTDPGIYRNQPRYNQSIYN